jgi:DNA helicase-2/ATP-dependent DNA helicase PcrA
MSQATLDRLFASIDTRANAGRLMAALDLHPNFPHHRAQGVTAGRIARRVQVHLTMFGANAGSQQSPWYLHRVWLNSSDRLIERQVQRADLPTRAGRQATWRVERQFVDLGAATRCAERLAEAGNSAVALWARLSAGKKYAMHPASHLRPTMTVPILGNMTVRDDEIVAVDEEPCSGTVYDLNVEHLHNYSANGMVVHNSVYGFRGADPRLLSEFPRTFPGAQVVVLEENHRSTRTIVSLANELAAPLGQRPASWTSNPEGLPARVYVADDDNEEAQFIAGEVARLLARGELAQPGQAAVLFRTNAQAQAFALALRARGLPVRLRSEADLFACPEVRDLVAYLRLAHSPQDQPALARILNTPPRRLRAVEQAFRKQPAPISEPTEWAHRRAGSTARAAVERLLALLAEIHAAARANRPV